MRTTDAVPQLLRSAAALSWRILVVAAAVVVVAFVFAKLALVFIPVVVGILLATVLVPPARWLRERRVPGALAAALVVLAALGVVGLVGWLLAPRVIEEFQGIDVGLGEAVDKLKSWVGEFGVPEERLDRYVERASDEIRSSAGRIAGGVLTGAVLVVEVLAGAVLTIFLLFFFVKDGARMWAWVVDLFPEPRRANVRAIGDISWQTLGGYLRGVAIVALVDAVFIGLALFLVGVPLVLPLAVLTFFGGFFPIVGAFAAGTVAVLIALVSNGLVAAVIILGAIILVQQIEGNVLEPFIVGRAVHLHPVVILLAVTAGAIVWGVVGAFLAVPLTAVAAKSAAHVRSLAT